MTAAEVWQLAQDPEIRVPLLVLAGIVGLLIGVVLRRFVRSERPDNILSNLAFLMGFGWSSEAVWVLTGPGGADLVTPYRVALFAVCEVVLIVFMIRAKRNMRILARPGRAGRWAWAVATGMSLVAVWTAHNPGEAFLRLLVPLLLTAMWWDGLVGEGAAKREDATSWRWTPRRLLLWLGAIEPGERDVEQVHRERLTQQMTRVEFDRRHTTGDKQARATRKLARLSLTADDDIVTEVQRRVDRASWFEPTSPESVPASSPASVSTAAASSARARRVRHGRSLRMVRATSQRPVIVAAQEPRQDPRATSERDLVIHVIKKALPHLPQTQLAHLAATTEPTVRRALRRPAPAEATSRINGRTPDLEGVDR